MTAEGRIARGKANYDSKKFLDNPETIAYVETLKEEKPKEVIEEVKEDKPKEKKKNDKSN